MSVNFALLLFVLLVITGAVCLLDRWYLRARRHRQMETALASFDTGRQQALRSVGGEGAVEAEQRMITHKSTRAPWWVEYSISFFPVILVVFLLRSFVAEPFRIPSGSMIPTLLVGDFILVNKYTYGVRLPILNRKIIDINLPTHGDVMVFRYPEDPSVDFIKRVIGLPGDRITYREKRLYLNGSAVPTQSMGEYFNADRVLYSELLTEKFGSSTHQVLNDRDKTGDLPIAGDFPMRKACVYNDGAVTCTIPAGHYFVMGDNRDYSHDSRYWGFVPEQNIVGKAFFIWMSLQNPTRIGRIH